jgi:isocitrate dehydrogenase
VRYSDTQSPAPNAAPRAPLYTRKPPARKELVGVDVFVHVNDVSADYLAGRLQTLAKQPAPSGFALQMITNRGVKVWPGGFPETFCTDHWRCRFMAVDAQGQPQTTSHAQIIRLLHNLQSDALDFIKIENLCTFDGEVGFALGQGQ